MTWMDMFSWFRRKPVIDWSTIDCEAEYRKLLKRLRG